MHTLLATTCERTNCVCVCSAGAAEQAAGTGTKRACLHEGLAHAHMTRTGGTSYTRPQTHRRPIHADAPKVNQVDLAPVARTGGGLLSYSSRPQQPHTHHARCAARRACAATPGSKCAAAAACGSRAHARTGCGRGSEHARARMPRRACGRTRAPQNCRLRRHAACAMPGPACATAGCAAGRQSLTAGEAQRPSTQGGVEACRASRWSLQRLRTH
jgi:hypothetical protein